MSAAPTKPTPSPIPERPSRNEAKHEDVDSSTMDDLEKVEGELRKIQQDIIQLEIKSAELEQSRPRPRPTFPKPKLRLKVQDLGHHGTEVFFANINPTTVLSKAVETVLSLLYGSSRTNKHIPCTRSITLNLCSMDGVADTGGSELNDNDKTIRFSLNYIDNICKDPGAEIQGVLVHEVVHCWQWNGLDSAPGGLIEGIADFVRMKAGLSPGHWKKEAGEKWDAGYQTTGYFLEWIESKFGTGSVIKINQALQDEKYQEKSFWHGLFGADVTDLWERYSKSLEEEINKITNDLQGDYDRPTHLASYA
ncbi:hypothetical protein ACLMJK_001792 [Lecanora helva]